MFKLEAITIYRVFSLHTLAENRVSMNSLSIVN